MTGFTPRTWVNDSAPAISAANLQAMDDGIEDAHDEIQVIEDDINYPSTVKQKAITDTGEDGGIEGGVFNGDFEYGEGSTITSDWIGDEKYGYRLHEAAGQMEAAYDITTSHRGIQSMRVSCLDVSGSGYAIQNRLEMKPSTGYRLSGYIKTNNVATNAVYISFNQYNSADGFISQTTAPNKLSGTNDWTYIEIIFTSDSSAAYIRLQLENVITGNISDAWFDDIKLEQIDTQTVNTQMDEIASVQIEGVTTTDNVDQYLETSGNTYTLATSINEGATHRQTFTPTADRGDGKHILSKIQALVAAIGTGDWTLTVHDAANNVLASQTIVNGSMSTGDIDFDVPAILDVGSAYHFHITSTVADGTVTTTDANDLETVDYHAQFGKHTESPIIEANGSSLDLTGVKLLTGATITVNSDGSGKFVWENADANYANMARVIATDAQYISDTVNFTSAGGRYLSLGAGGYLIWKFDAGFAIHDVNIRFGEYNDLKIYYSTDRMIWIEIVDTTGDTGDTDDLSTNFSYEGISDTVFIKVVGVSANSRIDGLGIFANLDCQAELPIFAPSSEVSSETEDLVLNPIDISEDGYWQLKYDLTGWGSRTITMIADEATWEAQAVSANTIYIFDSNGTTPWTWDDRNGLVPPADRISGAVMTKFSVGDNQIRSSVNNGSMKANVNLSWNEESVRAAINRLTAIANLVYPIVVEVEDVPAIDLQNEPSGASAETGYTNDVTSLRQTAAATPAIAYTGLLPRENRFSEWLDIEIICDDGDGVLQGKLYTADGTLIETYADLEANPVLTLSNPDYKYSRERMILQISASTETTSTAWSVTKVTWRYQYNG